MDTGPLVALFDPADADHQRCETILDSVEEPLLTTFPVLTEAFHLLTPASPGAFRLMDFVVRGGIDFWVLRQEHLDRAFALMAKYADHPMDFADASLVLTAEEERLSRIFTLDEDDFNTYRIKRSHRHVPFTIIP